MSGNSMSRNMIAGCNSTAARSALAADDVTQMSKCPCSRNTWTSICAEAVSSSTIRIRAIPDHGENVDVDSVNSVVTRISEPGLARYRGEGECCNPPCPTRHHWLSQIVPAEDSSAWRRTVPMYRPDGWTPKRSDSRHERATWRRGLNHVVRRYSMGEPGVMQFSSEHRA